MRTFFITGAGSGFGLALSRRVLASGDALFATDVQVDDLAERLGVPVGERLQVAPLDLARPASIEAACAAAVAWRPIDVLVNNGGYAVFVSQRDADMDAIERMFSVNVFGQARVTQALLDSVRSTRGVIVNLSSVAGRMVFPESGFYAASKFAMEALSEAQYVENAPFGVRVVAIEPGSFDTNFLARAAQESPPRRDDSPHAPQFEGWDERKLGMLVPPQPPRWVADAIYEASRHVQGFQRVRVGVDCRAILRIKDSLSPDDWSLLMGAIYGGPALQSDDSWLPLHPVLPQAVPEALRGSLTLAARSGHLAWWNDLEGGPQALAAWRAMPQAEDEASS